jgi:N-acetylmuramoyl-L-alanine amidase
MTRFIPTIAIGLLISVAGAAPALAQSQNPTPASAVAATLFTDASAKETAVRRALAAPSAQPTVLKAVRTVVTDYETIVRRFPSSGYCDDALWRAAQLSSEAFNQFGDSKEQANAIRLLQMLAARYPASKFAKQAPARITVIRAATPPRRVDEPAAAAAASVSAPAVGAPVPAPVPALVPTPAAAAAPPASARPPAAPSRGAIPAAAARIATVKDIRRSVMTDVVRIVIELDMEVAFHDERIENPSRVFVDMPSARLGPTLTDQTLRFDDDGDLVRQVRLGRQADGTTRVVLDAIGITSYSVYPLYNPYRLVIDCLRPKAVATATTTAVRPSAPVPASPGSFGRPAAPVVARATPPAPPLTSTRVGPEFSRLPAGTMSAHAAILEALLPPPPPAPVAALRPEALALANVSPPPIPPLPLSARRVSTVAFALPAVASVGSAVIRAALAAPPASVAAPVATIATPAVVATLPPAEPSRNVGGGFSIARQLGMGVSHIVIDPGHGGRDPGTTDGDDNEADLVLDVALRLEKLLAQQPGFTVTLTRRSDTFIPLQERTAIANRENADLFLSIHANANQSKQIQGVETYFLNFATNLSAAAVAARENAASGQLMGELPDVVRTIALNNKLDESRDFATHVQRELVSGLRPANKGMKDLGVKQAPFVVLIGAAMPSVLAEVSFMTNPQDAKLFKSASYRQKVAESLSEGLKKYQESLKSVPATATQ